MIKSIQKAIRLLSILADNYENPVSLDELSKKAEINKSTCSHIMSTLESEGYAAKISHSRGYVLGPAAYCLSRFGKYKNELVTTCRPIMRYLYRNTGYSIVLAVIEGDSKYIIDCIDDGMIFETKEQIRADDIYRTATGRAILANLSSGKVYDIFKKYGCPSSKEWPGINSFADLVACLSKMKKESVFKTRIVHESIQMVNIGYGIAIFNNLSCVGAIGVAVYIPCEEELEHQKEEMKIQNLLERCAKEINQRISSKG